MIPEPYEFVLLVLIAGRLWKLIADDEILEPLRDRLLDRIDTGSMKWELFLTCPWCAGFWISGVVYAAWLATLGDPTLSSSAVAVGLGMWLAVNALVGVYGLVVKNLQ
jgi:hypothetical protein